MVGTGHSGFKDPVCATAKYFTYRLVPTVKVVTYLTKNMLFLKLVPWLKVSKLSEDKGCSCLLARRLHSAVFIYPRPNTINTYHQNVTACNTTRRLWLLWRTAPMGRQNTQNTYYSARQIQLTTQIHKMHSATRIMSKKYPEVPKYFVACHFIGTCHPTVRPSSAQRGERNRKILHLDYLLQEFPARGAGTEMGVERCQGGREFAISFYFFYY